MHIRRFSRGTCALVVVAALALGHAFAASDPGDEVRPRAGTEGAASPVEDVEGGPLADAETFRRLTPIRPDELAAVDPKYREWARAIHEGRADKRIMRLHHYYRSRLEPFDRPFPSDWREDGLRRLRDTERVAASVRAYRENAAGNDGAGGIPVAGAWAPVGPYTIAGRVKGLAQPEGQPDTLYAASANGGVWRTTDRGVTWEPLSDFEDTLSGSAIVVDPNDPSILYFGTGETQHIDAYPGVGVLKSTDGGMTWTASNDFSPYVWRLAIHAAAPSRLFAAGQGGCYVSNDGAVTFALIAATGLPAGEATDVAVRPDDADTVFCAFRGQGVYRSQDGGTTWSALTSGLPSSGTGRIALAIAPSDGNVVAVSLEQNQGDVFKSVDGGDTWDRVNGGTPLAHCGGQCWYDQAIAFDPVDPDRIYVGGIGLYRSTNGGDTWESVGSGVHVDHHFLLAPSAGIVFDANDGGIYHSDAGGANGTFVEWSIGVDNSQYYGICNDPDDDFIVWGGTQDNGTHRRRPADDWTQPLGGDGGMCMTGPAGTDIVIAEFQNHAMRRSTNDGGSWSGAEDGIDGDDPRAWVGVLEVDRGDRNNMWTVTNDIYRSMDAKATPWEKVATTPHCGGGLTGCLSARAISVSPADSGVVWVGFGASSPVPPFADGKRAGVYRTANGLDPTVTWTDVSDPTWPYRSVRAVTAHPDDPATAYVVLGGLGAGKVWKSSDSGVTWTDRTGDHPDIPVNDLLVDADNPGTLLTATDLGVFRSDDDGATWYAFSNALPRSAAIEFNYNRATGVLRVGTHGRSVWEFRPSAAGGVGPVPDGNRVAGTPMRASRLDGTTMRVTWDVAACTAADYNLFWGDLEAVASLTYDDASCSLGASGTADVPIPVTASGNAFFVLAGSDGVDVEGVHGYDGNGALRSTSGIGLCGIASQDSSSTCP